MTWLLRIALALTLFAPCMAHAQEGRVHYSVTTTLGVELPPEMAHMQDQVPTETTDQRVMLFDESATVTRGVPADDSDARDLDFEDGSDGEMRIVVRRPGSGSDRVTHVDLDTGVVTEKRDFLGRDFRIVREQPFYAWRLTGEQSEFLGYPCQKAVAERDSMTVEAWFTSAIPASAGPEAYGGLPGLILVLTAGNTTFEATEVDLSPLDDDVLEAPTGGSEVTSEEFAQIVEERMRDLETTGISTTSPSGGRSTFRVIRRSN